MSEKLRISEFIYLFASVCYANEQGYFNSDNLKYFMIKSFGLDKESEYVSEEIDESIDSMVMKDYADRVGGYKYLVKINEKLPYMTFLKHRVDYLPIMSKFFYQFNNYCFLENKNNYYMEKIENPLIIENNKTLKKTIK